MTTLTEFLLARIAADEKWANARQVPGDWTAERLPDWVATRMLAECEAKRRIIRRHSRTTADHWSGAGNCEGCGFEGDMDLAVTPDYEICPELADLASVYADHPDFREEWRV